jgi:hypothetical protein
LFNFLVLFTSFPESSSSLLLFFFFDIINWLRKEAIWWKN